MNQAEYERVLAALLLIVDACYQEIVACHHDAGHFNGDSSKFREVMTAFERANADVFRFKQFWAETQRALATAEELAHAYAARQRKRVTP